MGVDFGSTTAKSIILDGGGEIAAACIESVGGLALAQDDRTTISRCTVSVAIARSAAPRSNPPGKCCARRAVSAL